MTPYMRWMVRNDLPEVAAIERALYTTPWSEQEILEAARPRHVVTNVVEVEEKIVGYFMYETHENRYILLNMGIHPDFQRKSIGRAMIEKLTERLHGKKTSIYVHVRERALSTQLFFKAMGFRATKIIKNFYENPDEDCYRMTYKVKNAVEIPESISERMGSV